MVHGPDSGFVTEDSVDELWTRASVPARRFAFRRLTHDIGFSRRWLQRLDGHGSLCRTTPFPGPTDPLPDPLPVADPDLPTEGWEANVAAAVAERGAAAVTESVDATLLERHTVPARLRLGLARTAGKAKGLCEGRFSQNPTEPAVFDDPSFWAEGELLDDGRRTEL